MTTETLTVRRRLLEIIEQSWRIPNGHPAKVSPEAEVIIGDGLRELRETLALPVCAETDLASQNAELKDLVRVLTTESKAYKSTSLMLEDLWGVGCEQQARTKLFMRALEAELENGHLVNCRRMIAEHLTLLNDDEIVKRPGDANADMLTILDKGLIPMPAPAGLDGFYTADEMKAYALASLEGQKNAYKVCRKLHASMESLQDPEVVLVNMLHGTIAKPSARAISKLYGEVLNDDDARLLEIARLRARESELVEMLQHWLQLSNVSDQCQSQLAVETAALIRPEAKNGESHGQ